MKKLALAALLLASVPAQANAQSILWWTDFNVGTSVIPGALALGPWSSTAATDESDFLAKLALGGWDLVIFGEQNSGSLGTSRTAVGNWVTGGGRAMYMSWLDTPLLGTFGASHAGFNSYALSGGGPLFAGISSPVGLLNLAWGVDNQYYNTLGGATCLADQGGACGAVLGNGGRTLLLGPLSDTYADQAQGERFFANGIGVVLGDATAVPEPGSIALVATGLVGLGFARRRKRAA